MIELLCTDYNKKATFIHYYLSNAVLAIFNIDDVFNIALMHKLVYSAYFGDNFGGYKIYNEDQNKRMNENKDTFL